MHQWNTEWNTQHMIVGNDLFKVAIKVTSPIIRLPLLSGYKVHLYPSHCWWEEVNYIVSLHWVLHSQEMTWKSGQSCGIQIYITQSCVCWKLSPVVECPNCFKMLYVIGPDRFINLVYTNFQEMVWVTMICLFRFRMFYIFLMLTCGNNPKNVLQF